MRFCHVVLSRMCALYGLDFRRGIVLSDAYERRRELGSRDGLCLSALGFHAVRLLRLS